MEIGAVPQEGNATLAGQRKLVYARAADGRMVGVATPGWEAEEIVTTQAVDALQAQALAAHARVLAGLSAPLEYWMYARRMDVALLSQSTGLWRWRVRRHLRAAIYAGLSLAHKQRYADALGLTVQAVDRLP